MYVKIGHLERVEAVNIQYKVKKKMEEKAGCKFQRATRSTETVLFLTGYSVTDIIISKIILY